MLVPVAGVLVGGASSRMGAPKGLLRAPDGEVLVPRIVRALRATGTTCALVGRRAEYAETARALALPVLDDDPGARGPLAGLLALFGWAGERDALALACDLPYVTPDLVQKLARTAVPPGAGAIAARREGRWEPLFARYRSAAALGEARRAAASGRFALQALLDDLRAVTLELDAHEAQALDDWDTPDDVL